MFPLFFAPAGSMLPAVVAAVFGLLIGSFLNVVIHRLPRMMQREAENWTALDAGQPIPHTDTYNLNTPRSACPACGHKITALENIPLLSYAVLRGRCRACQSPISWRYPFVELFTALLSFAMIWHFGSGVAGLASLLFIFFLIAMTGIDADTTLLPDTLTLTLMWGGLLLNTQGVFAPLHDAVYGAAAGYMVLWCVFWAFKLLTGKEGMGYGDFKLLAALGAWMGWKMLPLIILLSSLVGAIVGIAMIVLLKRAKDKPIPFGPYLAVAGLIAFVYGKPLVYAYLEVMR